VALGFERHRGLHCAPLPSTGPLLGLYMVKSKQLFVVFFSASESIVGLGVVGWQQQSGGVFGYPCLIVTERFLILPHYYFD